MEPYHTTARGRSSTAGGPCPAAARCSAAVALQQSSAEPSYHPAPLSADPRFSRLRQHQSHNQRPQRSLMAVLRMLEIAVQTESCSSLATPASAQQTTTLTGCSRVCSGLALIPLQMAMDAALSEHYGRVHFPPGPTLCTSGVACCACAAVTGEGLLLVSTTQ